MQVHSLLLNVPFAPKIVEQLIVELDTHPPVVAPDQVNPALHVHELIPLDDSAFAN